MTITKAGYDADPEALIVAEACCDVCGLPADAVSPPLEGDGLVIQAFWPGDERRWTPLFVTHRGRCDAVMRRALNEAGACQVWTDLGRYLVWLRTAVDTPGGTPGEGTVIEGATFLRRHGRRIDWRRTADVMDAVAGAGR
jgi:hypothetical protein